MKLFVVILSTIARYFTVMLMVFYAPEAVGNFSNIHFVLNYFVFRMNYINSHTCLSGYLSTVDTFESPE